MIKISFHSICDLITNSSTTIFSWYDGSVEACRSLIDEILVTFDINRSVDDMFYINVFLDEFYRSSDGSEDEDTAIPDMTFKEQEELKLKILREEIEKPTWMIKAEERAKEWDNYQSIMFYIEAKEPRYQEIANRLQEFLHSPKHQEAYN